MPYCTCTPGEEIQLDGDDHGDDDDDDDERDDDDECFVESDDADALRRRMGGVFPNDRMVTEQVAGATFG